MVGDEITTSDTEVPWNSVVEPCWGKTVGVSDEEDGDDSKKVLLLNAAETVE